MRVSSFTIKGNSDSFKTLIGKELEKGFQPTLCLAYTDSLFPYQAAAEVLSEQNIHLLGTTTAGEISNDKVCTESFSGLLLDIQPDYYDVIVEHFYEPSTGYIQNIWVEVIDTFGGQSEAVNTVRVAPYQPPVNASIANEAEELLDAAAESGDVQALGMLVQAFAQNLNAASGDSGRRRLAGGIALNEAISARRVLVQTVEEFGIERPLDLFEHAVLHVAERGHVVLRPESHAAALLDKSRADVGSHDQEAVLEVDGVSQAIG